VKLILYVEDSDKAIEAVVASRSMEKHPGLKLLGVRMTSGTVFSIERRSTKTIVVHQQREDQDES
jgi:hypothetical protein